MLKKRIMSLILAIAILFQIGQPLLAQELGMPVSEEKVVETTEDSQTEASKGKSVQSLAQTKAVDNAKTLTIVHYNDTHGRYKYEADKTIGYAKAKTIIDQYKAQGPTIVLDAGDTTHGTNFATLSEGKNILDLMDKVGLDAFVPGNHDFNYGSDRLVELSKLATNFDVLSSNIIKEADGTKLFESHKIYDKNGIKVGVFASSTPETVYKSHPDNTRGLNFDKVVEEAEKSIQALKDGGAEVIIFLSHLGMDQSSEINTYTFLDTVKGKENIDVVIDGHSHTLLKEGKDYNGTFIASAGQYFENMGITTVKINADGTKTEASKLIPASSVADIAEDKDISAYIKDAEAKNAVILNEVIGNTTTALDGERANVRTRETNGADLVTDSMLHATGADLVITNGGGIRKSIDAGEITMNEALEVLPFGNLVTVIKVSGQDILDALEYGVSKSPDAAGHFPQVSGVKYAIELNPSGNKVVDVTIQGSDLDLNKTYELATNDFMAAGGDGYTMFEGKPQVGLYGSMLELYTNYIKKLSADGPFTYNTDGRIKVVVPNDEVKQDNPNKIIKEVNAHVGADSKTSENISWVTVEETEVSVKVRDEYGSVVYEQKAKGTSNGNVFTYTAELKDLKQNTKYVYILENEFNRVVGSFKTAFEKGASDKVVFAYIADPQVNTPENAEATGAIFNELSKFSKIQPLDFLYIAGDHTDNSSNETQWHNLFHNGGLFPNATQEFLKNNTLLSTQGNHDAADFAGHINQPEVLGEEEFLKGVYSSDFGNVRFIMLNNASYNVSDLANNANFNKMVDFLKQKVNGAKEQGMWTIVGFHKPLYTGASHISDGDVIEYRKALNPILSELDVDMVLSGHDHVYSRGFVNAEGRNASVVNDELTKQNGVRTFSHVKGAPLHMVAEHGGGLKWYSAVDYPITNGDPIVPNYGFLDYNSAADGYPTSDVAKMQTYVIVEATDKQIEFKSAKFKYEKGQITKETEIFDNFIITKDITQEPVKEVGELTNVLLKADNTKLDANKDEKAQMLLTYYDPKYYELDIKPEKVEYVVSDKNLIKVDENGVVSIVNKPEEIATAKVKAVVTVGGKQFETNEVTISVETPYVLPEGALVYQITSGDDDVEDAMDGSAMYTDSSDLEITQDGDVNQMIGLRFNDIRISKGKKIKEAYIKFTVDEVKKSKNVDPFAVKVSGQLSPNAEEFKPVAGDALNRTKTKSSVAWENAPKWLVEGMSGKGQMTPNIAEIINEIISQDGWVKGNSLALFLEGQGVRCADAFEDSEEGAPKLIIVLEDGEVETDTGWVVNGEKLNYYDNDGSQVKSDWRWAPILDENGQPTGKFNWKYFDAKGNNITQIYTENGKSWISPAGSTVEYYKGWWTNPASGAKYYFRQSSGSMVTGRQFIDGNWMIFRKSGTLAYGWQYVNGKWSFSDKVTGRQAVSEWKWVPIIDKDGKETGKFNWKYLNDKGQSITQIYKENGMLWLSQAGPMNVYYRGWWTNPDTGAKYFFRLNSGTMVKGEQFIDGAWRFFRTSGTMATGWQKIGDVWKYYRVNSGTRVSGRQFIDGKWYEFTSKGSVIGSRF